MSAEASLAKATGDWAADATRFAKALTPQLRAELAGVFGLPVRALDTVVGLGYTRHGIKQSDGQWLPAWTIPMHDASENVVGILKRFATRVHREGEDDPPGERIAGGSALGLFIPTGWKERPGPVFIVEGVGNVLALTMCGLASVGHPASSACPHHLYELLRDLPADRGVIVLRDGGKPKAQASIPDRAMKLANSLRERIRSFRHDC